MSSFRYRTATLLGPWRESAEAAAEDAIRAKQARRDADGESWQWVVPGLIEERGGGPRQWNGDRRASQPERNGA